MKFLCWLGLHDWGAQENVRGGSTSNSVAIAILFEVLSPRVCNRRCLRCGKVKEFAYDPRR
jgi:hypothetical protein